MLKRGLRSQSLFEAYLEYVHSPKHTIGEQLLDVRRDKRERAALARSQADESPEAEEEEEENENDSARSAYYGWTVGNPERTL
jgi:hypothetical protein